VRCPRLGQPGPKTLASAVARDEGFLSASVGHRGANGLSRVHLRSVAGMARTGLRRLDGLAWLVDREGGMKRHCADRSRFGPMVARGSADVDFAVRRFADSRRVMGLLCF
jgi:hypothetical protein